MFETIRNAIAEYDEECSKYDDDVARLEEERGKINDSLSRIREKRAEFEKKRNSVIEGWEPEEDLVYAHKDKAGLWKLTEYRSWYASEYNYNGPVIRMTFRRVKKGGEVDWNKNPITVSYKFTEDAVRDKKRYGSNSKDLGLPFTPVREIEA